ncbi:MAG TPA: hypothetical protein DE109_04110 [Aeromonas sp.]|nr:hypothetical protein [Aeromonas sp.]
MTMNATVEPSVLPESTEAPAPPKPVQPRVIDPASSDSYSRVHKWRAQKAIAISDIHISERYQLRKNKSSDLHVQYMMGLIIDGITFNAPIRLACIYGNQLHLVDGFHRVEAYKRLRRTEIPISQLEIVEVQWEDDAELLAMAANTTHGLKNSPADLHNILMRIAERGYPRGFMKNAFELDIPTIALSIGASKTILEAAYNRYTGPKDSPHSTLSTLCKARRDEAIMDDYGDGMTANAIATKYRIKSSKTVTKVLADHEARLAEWERQRAEQVAQEEAEWVARAAKFGYGEDRLDIFKANAHIFESVAAEVAGVDVTSNGENQDPNDLSVPWVESDDPAFDIYAVTGFKSEPETHARPVKVETMSPEQLQAAWQAFTEEKAKTVARLARKEKELRKAAELAGVALPE